MLLLERHTFEALQHLCILTSSYLEVNTCHMVGPIPVVRVCSHTHLTASLGPLIMIILEILE